MLKYLAPKPPSCGKSSNTISSCVRCIGGSSRRTIRFKWWASLTAIQVSTPTQQIILRDTVEIYHTSRTCRTFCIMTHTSILEYTCVLMTALYTITESWNQKKIIIAQGMERNTFHHNELVHPGACAHGYISGSTKNGLCIIYIVFLHNTLVYVIQLCLSWRCRGRFLSCKDIAGWCVC